MRSNLITVPALLGFPMALALLGGDHSCPHVGSRTVGATWEAGPASGCTYAPSSPAWELLTPARRAPVARWGFAPGDARERPRLLVRYRCTGWWLLPRVVAEVRALGTVTDVAERACQPVTGS